MNSLASPKCNDMLRDWESTADYTEVFIHQTNCLFLLSLLVTADHGIAETCFSRALDEYVEGRDGFLVWARDDGRRAVLRQAIQIVRPMPNRSYSWSITRAPHSLLPTARHPFAAITSLSAFERFVFVMSEIEGFSDAECAGLLDCNLQDVAVGRELAPRIIATEEIDDDLDIEAIRQVIPALPDISNTECVELHEMRLEMSCSRSELGG